MNTQTVNIVERLKAEGEQDYWLEYWSRHDDYLEARETQWKPRMLSKEEIEELDG